MLDDVMGMRHTGKILRPPINPETQALHAAMQADGLNPYSQADRAAYNEYYGIEAPARLLPGVEIYPGDASSAPS